MLNKLKARISQFEDVHYIAIIFAVTTQIQCTLFAHESYLGLRIGLADMLLPFAGLYVLHSLITKKSKLPNWSIKTMWYWIAALVLVMSTSLINGYIVNGALSSWALINKYIGFYILLSYLALGGWVMTNTQNQIDTLALFAKTFTIFFILTVFASLALFFLQYFLQIPLFLPHYPWDGFMANRNAFTVLFVLAFIYIIWSYANSEIKIPDWICVLFWLCMPMFFVFNESRTGWIAAGILGIIFFLKNPIQRAKKSIPFFLIGILVAYSSYFLTTKATEYILGGVQMRFLIALTQEEQGNLEYIGDQKRYIAVEDGLEMYKQYNPLIGAGLGSYKPFQIEKRGEFIDVIDFTALWLLVETGIAGIIVFAAFFGACAWSVYKTGFMNGNSPYHRAMLSFLIFFAAMSILHEIMYTRVIWLAMGLGLVTMTKWKNKAST